MKFVEALILLYTPDPSVSLESPSQQGIFFMDLSAQYVKQEFSCFFITKPVAYTI